MCFSIDDTDGQEVMLCSYFSVCYTLFVMSMPWFGLYGVSHIFLVTQPVLHRAEVVKGP